MTCFDPYALDKWTFKKLIALEEDLLVLDYQLQHAKKDVSNSLGLVDFAIRLVFSVLNLPNGKWCCLGKFKLQKDCNQSCESKRVLGLVDMTWGLVHATTSCKSTWDTVPYFGINSLSMISCLWSPLHPLSKLLAIQDHTQNLEEQLWMGGRREVSIIFYRPVTRSDLKQERSFFCGSVSSFLQLVVARACSHGRL